MTISKICALLGGALLLAAQPCFAEDYDPLGPKDKAELAALPENGRAAFKRALIACSLYVDEPSNAGYEEDCKATSKAFTVEFTSQKFVSVLFGEVIIMTRVFEANRTLEIQQGRVPQGSNGAKLFIEALQKAYRDSTLHPSNAAITPKTVQPSAVSPSRTTVLIPLRRNGGEYVVPVLINKAITLDFVVDSGATDVSIPADVVLTLIRTGTLHDADFIGTRLINSQTARPSSPFNDVSHSIFESEQSRDWKC